MLDKPLLIYDGICNLCVTAAKFLHRMDRYRFNYMAYQQISRETLSTLDQMQGQMCLILEDGRVMSGAVAISEVCKRLFPISFLCELLESPFLQKLYIWLAKQRYGIFGCKQSCFMFEEI